MLETLAQRSKLIACFFLTVIYVETVAGSVASRLQAERLPQLAVANYLSTTPKTVRKEEKALQTKANGGPIASTSTNADKHLHF